MVLERYYVSNPTTAYAPTRDLNSHGASHMEVWGYEYAESMDTFEVSKSRV